MLTRDEKRTLLALARQTLASSMRGEEPDSEIHELAATAALREPRGVFVTLRRDGELRGCIGSIAAVVPLCDGVVENTISAAERDPRFPPVRADEEPRLTIELSVLGPLEPFVDASEIEVGRHGILMRNGPRSGLLLPQVASEWNWDATTFLEQTCQKAGLPSHAWRDPATQRFRFTAEVFGEESA